MRPIEGKTRNIRELLGGVKYSIDYYQREYRWETKQIHELLDDLTGVFLEDYKPGIGRSKVKDFSHYFLGSIIISQKDGESFIVDGQQRLTSLTLLLTLLRNLQRDRDDVVNVDGLIFSEQYGEKTFNLAVKERENCMEALFEGEPFDITERSESVQNIYSRYQDMESYFPQDLQDEALPYFADWLIEKVYLVEISAYSDEDAYTIFETMNDRGLSLSPTDMLKGYLLANMDPDQRTEANNLWRNRIHELSAQSDDHVSDFFKSWLRSQYASNFRDSRKGSMPIDFERIGTEFHRWVRDKRTDLRLKGQDDFFEFICQDFEFYGRQYLRIKEAQSNLVDGLEHIFYNASHGFTLQEMVLLAPLRIGDDDETIKFKMRLVARFVDIFITWRVWNSRARNQSTVRDPMFRVVSKIRKCEPRPLAKALHEELLDESETFASNERFGLMKMNRPALHRILARMTDYVETQSGEQSRYAEYVASGRNRYEVEHIWANHPGRHAEEFPHPADFTEQRNRLGGLLLLQKKFNASYGDLPYEEKLPHYNTQNLLARSLHPQAYEHNPGFVRFVRESGLPFRPHEQFTREDMDLRSELYRQMAERIWNPEDLIREVEAFESAPGSPES